MSGGNTRQSLHNQCETRLTWGKDLDIFNIIFMHCISKKHKTNYCLLVTNKFDETH